MMSSKEGGGLEIEVRKLPDNDTKVIPGGMDRINGWSMGQTGFETLQWGTSLFMQKNVKKTRDIPMNLDVFVP